MNLRASLLRVRDTGRPDSMALQRYDILVPHDGFAVRYWSPVNVPVLDAAGRVEFILHQVLDVTDYVREREQGLLARARGEDWRRRMEAAEADLFARAHELQRLNAELLEARDQLRRRALHDSLTGLLVREVFFEELTRALQRQARHHRPLAVLFIDLDRLKHVNDSYGTTPVTRSSAAVRNGCGTACAEPIPSPGSAVTSSSRYLKTSTTLPRQVPWPSASSTLSTSRARYPAASKSRRRPASASLSARRRPSPCSGAARAAPAPARTLPRS